MSTQVAPPLEKPRRVARRKPPSAALYEVVVPLVATAAAFLVWELVCQAFKVPSYLVPPPSAIWNETIAIGPTVFWHSVATLKTVLLGFLFSIAISLPLAVLLTASPAIASAIYPFLVWTQSVPKVALAPVLLVWLGTGIESKLAIVWLVAFFPIIVDTSAGLRSTPRELLELARSLRASRWQVFAMVQFPAALPFIMAGAKVAVTLAVIGAVIGEFIGSNDGLGTLLLTANSQVNTPLVFACLFGLSVIGLVSYGAVVLVERLLAPWLPPGAKH